MTRRIKHAKTALATPSVAYTDWNDWLVDELGVDIDLNSMSGPMVFNAAQADVDFTIKSDTKADAFVLDGAYGGIGLGVAPGDNWGVVQLWLTGSPAAGYNAGGWYGTVLLNPATDQNHDAYGLRGECVVQNGTPTGGYPTSDITGVYGYARTSGSNSELDKVIGGSFEAAIQGKAVTSVYGIMAQARNNSSQNATVGTMWGIYADAYTTDPSAGKTLTINTAYGAELRTFCKTNAATSVSRIDTLYGLFSAVYCQQAVGGTSTIDNAYNLYVYHDRPGGGIPEYGLVTSYYGLYSASLATMNATSKWAVYIVDGKSYFGGQVGIGIAAPAASAAVDITSTTGALLIPRMTTTEKNALTAVNGMIVYDATLNKFQGYENGAWTSLI